MSKTVSLVVDMQYDFMDFQDSNLPIPGSKDIIPLVNQYLESLRNSDTEAVLFTQDWHTPEHVEYDPDGNAFPQHCVMGTRGADIVVSKNTVPKPIPILKLKKNMFDMWGEKDLDVLANDHVSQKYLELNFETTSRDSFFEVLKQRGVTDVEVCGVAADVCVDQAVNGLVERGFNVTILENMTAGIFKDMKTVVNEKYQNKVKLV